MLDHLAADKTGQSRIYATAAALQFLLRTINPTSTWGKRLHAHLQSFPVSPVSTINQAGFPIGWETLELWQ
jgi:hypothetical protein